MYLLPFLLTSDFLVLNILSLPAGNPTPACVSISHYGEAKCEVTVDRRVYYMVSCQVGEGACFQTITVGFIVTQFSMTVI